MAVGKYFWRWRNKFGGTEVSAHRAELVYNSIFLLIWLEGADTQSQKPCLQALYYLSHPLDPLCFSYFSGRVSDFFQGCPGPRSSYLQ
jgi:hypothetical protein